MQKRYRVAPTQNEGLTLSTEEYLKKKEQEEIDKIFDAAIAEAKAKELEAMKEEVENKTLAEMVFKLADAEAEVSIQEELLSDAVRKEEDLSVRKEELKKSKMRFTTCKNKLERWCSANV